MFPLPLSCRSSLWAALFKWFPSAAGAGTFESLCYLLQLPGPGKSETWIRLAGFRIVPGVGGFDLRGQCWRGDEAETERSGRFTPFQAHIWLPLRTSALLIALGVCQLCAAPLDCGWPSERASCSLSSDRGTRGGGKRFYPVWGRRMGVVRCGVPSQPFQTQARTT